MKLGESSIETIVRGISEELGVDGDIALEPINKIENVADSKSYPGLQTKSTTYLFEAILTPEQFNPLGYAEEQLDKITYCAFLTTNASDN